MKKIKDVILMLLSKLVPSMYQVDMFANITDNQINKELLDRVCTKLDETCTKSIEMWDDIRVLNMVVQVVYRLSSKTSLKDLMKLSTVTNRNRFKKLVLDPLLQLGIAEMTIPDKPNSRNQLYRLSEVGKKIFFI